MHHPFGYRVPLPDTLPFPFPYSYWSSEMCGRVRRHHGTRRTGNHQLLEGIGCRRVHRLEPAGHSRHQLQLQRPGGQHGDMGRYQGKILQIAPAELWKLQQLLCSKKGSLSQTHKKVSEANTKVYDLNQRTMQALNTFEQASANLKVEFSEGTCSSPTCVRQRKHLQKLNRTRNVLVEISLSLPRCAT